MSAMKEWPVQDAKARFSELVEASLEEGPQVVTKRGVATVVVVPMEQWRRMVQSARPTLKALLLGAEPRVELNVPPRGRRRRSPVVFT